MRLHWTRRTRLYAQIVLSGVGLAVTIAAALMLSTASGAGVGHGSRARAATASLVPSFALLRGPQGQSPPADLTAAVRRAPTEYGLQIGGARFASATGAWLIPGAGWLCIATTDSEGLGMSCSPAPSAERGKLAFVIQSTDGERATVVGAAPDGATEAAAQSTDGARVADAPVRENTYRLSGSRVARTTLSGSSDQFAPPAGE